MKAFRKVVVLGIAAAIVFGSLGYIGNVTAAEAEGTTIVGTVQVEFDADTKQPVRIDIVTAEGVSYMVNNNSFFGTLANMAGKKVEATGQISEKTVDGVTEKVITISACREVNQ